MRVTLRALNTGLLLRSVTVCEELDVKLAVCSVCDPECVRYQLARPTRIAMARDASMSPVMSQPVDDDFLNGESLAFGEDVTYGYGRKPAWEDESKLKAKMRALLQSFADGDPDGKASRLLEAFLSGKREVAVWSDPALDLAVESHENFRDFSDMAMNAPGHGRAAAAGKVRIHQALKNAGWNIRRMRPITDLGILAFNRGPLRGFKSSVIGVPDPNKVFRLGDFDNGLGLMINGEQYAFVVAESYDYSSCAASYEIKLKFVLYDVFGLDDEDLSKFGFSMWRPGPLLSAAEQGISAWWALQHELGYAPLITRAVVRRTYTVSTKDS